MLGRETNTSQRCSTDTLSSANHLLYGALVWSQLKYKKFSKAEGIGISRAGKDVLLGTLCITKYARQKKKGISSSLSRLWAIQTVISQNWNKWDFSQLSYCWKRLLKETVKVLFLSLSLLILKEKVDNSNTGICIWTAASAWLLSSSSGLNFCGLRDHRIIKHQNSSYNGKFLYSFL